MYVWILPSKNSKIYIYTYILSWPGPPSNSHPQDDITCLGSGIPIDLHFATITGKVANPICINLNVLMYIAKDISLVYMYIYIFKNNLCTAISTHSIHNYKNLAWLSCIRPRQRKKASPPTKRSNFAPVPKKPTFEDLSWGEPRKKKHLVNGVVPGSLNRW